jgi:hypothetical protein
MILKIALTLILALGALGTAFVLRPVGDAVAGLYLGLVLVSAIGWVFSGARISRLMLAVFWLSLLPTVWLISRLALTTFENLPGGKTAPEDYIGLGFLGACAVYLCIFAWFTGLRIRDSLKPVRI